MRLPLAKRLPADARADVAMKRDRALAKARNAAKAAIRPSFGAGFGENPASPVEAPASNDAPAPAGDVEAMSPREEAPRPPSRARPATRGALRGDAPRRYDAVIRPRFRGPSSDHAAWAAGDAVLAGGARGARCYREEGEGVWLYSESCCFFVRIWCLSRNFSASPASPSTTASGCKTLQAAAAHFRARR